MPNEGELSAELQGLNKAAVDLLVNVHIISSIAPRWPDEVQGNWLDEVQQMRERLDDYVRVAQEFASALD